MEITANDAPLEAMHVLLDALETLNAIFNYPYTMKDWKRLNVPALTTALGETENPHHILLGWHHIPKVCKPLVPYNVLCRSPLNPLQSAAVNPFVTALVTQEYVDSNEVCNEWIAGWVSGIAWAMVSLRAALREHGVPVDEAFGETPAAMLQFSQSVDRFDGQFVYDMPKSLVLASLQQMAHVADRLREQLLAIVLSVEGEAGATVTRPQQLMADHFFNLRLRERAEVIHHVIRKMQTGTSKVSRLDWPTPPHKVIM